MATVTKDFRVKNGLVVEGSTATVNGHDVLTESLVDAKGDLLVGSADNTVTRLAAGTNGYVLTADSSTTEGIKWAAAPAVGSFETSIVFEGATADSFETTLQVTDPTADRTITFPDATGTVALTSQLPTQYTDEMAQDAVGNALGTGLSYNDGTGAISVDTATIQARVADVSDTEIGYLNGVTSAIQTQLDAKFATANASTTNISEGTNLYFTDERAQDAVGNSVGTGLSYNDSTGAISVNTSTIQARVADVSDTEIGYLNGVTSAIQTQLDAKFATANASTTNISEGTNLYFTDERAQDAIGNNVGNGLDYDDSSGAISVDPSEFALNAVGAPTAAVSMATYKITSLGTPTDATDAATKAYVDSVTEGLHIHESAVAATTANVNLANALENGDTLDGVTLATGNRILVKNQTTTSENGIYVVQASGQPTRATDFDTAAEVDSGDFIFVYSGTVNGSTGWVQTNKPATIGTDPITFTQFSGAGTYLAGNGLTLTGNSFSINTGVTVDLSTAQTLTNKSISGSANTLTNIPNNALSNSAITINGTSTSLGGTRTLVTDDIAEDGSPTNLWFTDERAQDAVGTILTGGLTYNDSTPGIGINYVTVGDTLLDGVSGQTFGLIGTSVYLDIKNTNGYNKEIELDIAAVESKLNTDGYITTSSTSTLTNKTLTSPKINEDVALTATATELNYVDGVTSAIQTQLDAKAPLLSPSFTTPNIGAATATSITLTDALIGTATQALTDANATVVDSWSATTYSTAKYIVQMTNGSDIEVLEVLVTIDGNDNVYLTEYANIISNASIGTTDADYSGGNVRLKVTASNGTTVKVHKTLIEA